MIILQIHVESMKQNVQQSIKRADPIIVALKVLTTLFEIPSISQIIMENARLHEKIENWKKLYACKLGNLSPIVLILSF